MPHLARFLTTVTLMMLMCGAPVALAALDCSGAVPVELNQTYPGDTTGLPDNVTLYGCSDWVESGGEIVHRLHLDLPHHFRVTLVPDFCDLDLVILDVCDENLGCLLVTDDEITTTSPLSGDIYLVVDGYMGAACPFDLILEDLGVPNQRLSFGQVKAIYER
ncbi:hypothetical protein H8E07_02505 [bacterium]|nr:hypothetical protein [bacterium]